MWVLCYATYDWTVGTSGFTDIYDIYTLYSSAMLVYIYLYINIYSMCTNVGLNKYCGNCGIEWWAQMHWFIYGSCDIKYIYIGFEMQRHRHLTREIVRNWWWEMNWIGSFVCLFLWFLFWFWLSYNWDDWDMGSLLEQKKNNKWGCMRFGNQDTRYENKMVNVDRINNVRILFRKTPAFIYIFTMINRVFLFFLMLFADTPIFRAATIWRTENWYGRREILSSLFWEI